MTKNKNIRFVCVAGSGVNKYTFEYRRSSSDSYKELSSGTSNESSEVELSDYFDIRCIPCQDNNCASATNVAESCTDQFRFEEEERGGFVVEKYDDQDGDASRDSQEPGLDWEFEWDLNHDNNWRAYQTHDEKNGRGDEVGGLKPGDVIRVREKGKDGWEATTSTEKTITIDQNQIKLVIFGNRRQKPTVTKGDVPVLLPKTGADATTGLSLASSLAGIGLGLKLLSLRLKV